MFPDSALGWQAPLGWPEAYVQSALILLTQFLAEASSSKSLLSSAPAGIFVLWSLDLSEQKPPNADTAFQHICPGPSPLNSPGPPDHPRRAASANSRKPFTRKVWLPSWMPSGKQIRNLLGVENKYLTIWEGFPWGSPWGHKELDVTERLA